MMAPAAAVRRLRRPLHDFIRSETSGAIILMLCAAIALVWANVAGESYARTWQYRLSIGVGTLALAKPLLLWINDGLMAIFFLVVGLEIKRELLTGELASVRRAALPVAAAAGGMVVPALLYAAVNAGGPGARGWGIPMATDIAFALGALALLGRRVPASLRVFLTAVAIVDDLGAIAVIAIFYSGTLGWTALATAAAGLAVLAALGALNVQRAAPYVLMGVVVWVAVLKSGVHATVAGVLVAMLVPARGATEPLLERLEHALHPWVAWAIMPVFALANAGVTLGTGVVAGPISLGVMLGLVVGKQAGITLASWLAVLTGVAALPRGAGWRQIYGVAVLCGIGFTMSLFIATLAFDDPAALAQSKVGILTGSLLCGFAGYLILARIRRD